MSTKDDSQSKVSINVANQPNVSSKTTASIKRRASIPKNAQTNRGCQRTNRRCQPTKCVKPVFSTKPMVKTKQTCHPFRALLSHRKSSNTRKRLLSTLWIASSVSMAAQDTQPLDPSPSDGEKLIFPAPWRSPSSTRHRGKDIPI